MSFKLNDNFKQLENNIKDMDGTHEVKLTELINKEFLLACSNFSSLGELIEAAGYKVESQEDFEAIPDDQWNEFIMTNTKYSSWEEMQEAATIEYTKKLLFKGMK
ncbi:hypothetical protein [Plesiomonas shigelloides]|uniref:hypothetical protein n=1 Tax=Plesiomonas shigelloides TaxID=703 RepID=UPI001E42765A|nr:hypothetical protein [Plesiomonas shigelloides]